MAGFKTSRWTPQFEGASRLDRKGCTYDAYLPDPLADWNLTLPADLAADVADAEAAVRQLNDAGIAHVSLEGLARFLLRAESVASSRIEGLEAGPRRLLEAEVMLLEGEDHSDTAAIEILGNITAMHTAIERAVDGDALSLADLLDVHRNLMDSSPHPDIGGECRTMQNWIGGSRYNPCSADFVPPPPERVEPLLADLVEYMNGDEHPPLVQAAVAHAQFETIHPFIDGNGRTGRALIHVVLVRRGLAPSFVPPVSLVLATWGTQYVAGLTAYRHVGPPESVERSEAAHRWLRTFTTAMARACADAEVYAERIDDLNRYWRERLGRVRKSSAVDLLLEALPGVPVLNVDSAARLIDRSTVRAGDAVNRLVDAGILKQRNVGRKRYRIFEAVEVLEMFISLERALASPTGNTVSAPPARPVPRYP